MIKVVGRAQTFWGFGVWYHNLTEWSFPTRIPSIKLRSTTKEVTEGCQPLLIAYMPCDMHDIVQTYVESKDGISGSDSHENLAENPTATGTVGFQNDLASQEIFELQRLEDMGLCEPIDDS
jgi:hypothetical protein